MGGPCWDGVHNSGTWAVRLNRAASLVAGAHGCIRAMATIRAKFSYIAVDGGALLNWLGC